MGSQLVDLGGDCIDRVSNFCKLYALTSLLHIYVWTSIVMDNPILCLSHPTLTSCLPCCCTLPNHPAKWVLILVLCFSNTDLKTQSPQPQPPLVSCSSTPGHCVPAPFTLGPGISHLGVVSMRQSRLKSLKLANLKTPDPASPTHSHRNHRKGSCPQFLCQPLPRGQPRASCVVFVTQHATPLENCDKQNILSIAVS